jgi:hypothetical protein
MTGWVNSVIIKNARIFNIIHNIFILRDIEVVICIILFYYLVKKADGLKHYIYILDITVRRHNNRTIVNFEPKFNWQ